MHKHIYNMNEIIEIIQKSLSSDLLNKKITPIRNNPLYGHCYVATEALYYLLDDDEKINYTPATIKVNGITHWFLKHKETGDIIDITKEQFNTNLDYTNSRNRFFLSPNISKRTLILLNRIYEKIDN